MHTDVYRVEGYGEIRAHHNGDWSGEVVFCWKEGDMEPEARIPSAMLFALAGAEVMRRLKRDVARHGLAGRRPSRSSPRRRRIVVRSGRFPPDKDGGCTYMRLQCDDGVAKVSYRDFGEAQRHEMPVDLLAAVAQKTVEGMLTDKLIGYVERWPQEGAE